MMNPEQEIYSLIELIKQDKRIVQPYRNDATAYLRRAASFVRTGMTTTDRQPDEQPSTGLSKPSTCTCPDPQYARRKDCPVHGDVA